MKSVLIGSVRSSAIVLKQMINTGFPINMVFSLDEQYSENVSGYYPIHEIAKEHGIEYNKFRKINEEKVVDAIRNISPDYIFVVGLSQIVGKDIIDTAKKGVVGFHPTPLPKFRGRAAMVWQILLGVHETKCTLFLIDEGMDSGDILGQEPYVLSDDDYAMDAQLKVEDALDRLSERVLTQINNGTINPIKQNEEEATYLLVRRPEDGLIDWSSSTKDIHRLIRAVSDPYPGAYSLYDGKHKIIIWKADIIENRKYIGIPGQICELHDDSFDVLGTDGIIRVKKYTNEDGIKLFVGHKMK